MSIEHEPAVSPLIPEDPVVWWRMFVDAVVAYQLGDYEPGNQYLRFVRLHRGNKQAQRLAQNIVECAQTPSWADCRLWPGWGYQTRNPAAPPPTKARNRRKR